MGSPHGYGIARRIERIGGGPLPINYGTPYPALPELGQEGHVTSEWGQSESNRRAEYYRLTRAGRRRLEKETRGRGQTTSVPARFLSPEENS
jgi:PadR family transcriptional regulator, regulatory protein PadR